MLYWEITICTCVVTLYYQHCLCLFFCGNIILLCSADVFKLAVNTEWFLYKLNRIYVHQFNVFPGIILDCFLLHLNNGLGPPTSTHCSEVANFLAFYAHLPICQALSQGMTASTMPACLLHGHSCLFSSSGTVFSCV